MKIVLIGAAGKVGRHLAREALARGHTVGSLGSALDLRGAGGADRLR